MKYERFEDLPVWQCAADLAAQMFEWTTHAAFSGRGDLANQLQRAALSISNNIAEGFERGSTRELVNFLYIARGSAGEVRSMLGVMQRTLVFAELVSEVTQLWSTCESISRQIRGWTNSLQNSEIEGPRHLTDRSRAQYKSRQRQKTLEQERRQWQAAFTEKLRRDAEQRNRDDERHETQDGNGVSN